MPASSQSTTPRPQTQHPTDHDEQTDDTIIIHTLPVSMSNRQLREWLRKIGIRGLVEKECWVSDPTCRRPGRGVVKFENAEGARKAFGSIEEARVKEGWVVEESAKESLEKKTRDGHSAERPGGLQEHDRKAQTDEDAPPATAPAEGEDTANRTLATPRDELKDGEIKHSLPSKTKGAEIVLESTGESRAPPLNLQENAPTAMDVNEEHALPADDKVASMEMEANEKEDRIPKAGDNASKAPEEPEAPPPPRNSKPASPAMATDEILIPAPREYEQSDALVIHSLPLNFTSTDLVTFIASAAIPDVNLLGTFMLGPYGKGIIAFTSTSAATKAWPTLHAALVQARLFGPRHTKPAIEWARTVKNKYRRPTAPRSGQSDCTISLHGAPRNFETRDLILFLKRHEIEDFNEEHTIVDSTRGKIFIRFWNHRKAWESWEKLHDAFDAAGMRDGVAVKLVWAFGGPKTGYWRPWTDREALRPEKGQYGDAIVVHPIPRGYQTSRLLNAIRNTQLRDINFKLTHCIHEKAFVVFRDHAAASGQWERLYRVLQESGLFGKGKPYMNWAWKKYENMRGEGNRTSGWMQRDGDDAPSKDRDRSRGREARRNSWRSSRGSRSQSWTGSAKYDRKRSSSEPGSTRSPTRSVSREGLDDDVLISRKRKKPQSSSSRSNRSLSPSVQGSPTKTHDSSPLSKKKRKTDQTQPPRSPSDINMASPLPCSPSSPRRPTPAEPSPASDHPSQLPRPSTPPHLKTVITAVLALQETYFELKTDTVEAKARFNTASENSQTGAAQLRKIWERKKDAALQRLEEAEGKLRKFLVRIEELEGTVGVRMEWVGGEDRRKEDAGK